MFKVGLDAPNFFKDAVDCVAKCSLWSLKVPSTTLMLAVIGLECRTELLLVKDLPLLKSLTVGGYFNRLSI